MNDSTAQLRKRLQRERSARLEAERLLEEKADELYESLMRIQSSEGLLRSALTSMADGLLLTNQYHEVILANDQLEEIYPDKAELFVPNSSLQGRFEALLEHPDYHAMLGQDRKEASFEIVLADQRTVSVSVRYTREGFIASTHRDITELKEAEEERRRLLVDLMRAQRMETIGRMSGMIAHDFNNIIASIKGYAGFLEEDMPDDADLRDSASRIASAADRAEQLIQQILEYGNQQQAPRHRVSLVPVLEDCLDMVVPAGTTGIDFEFNPPEEPIWVEANETRLGQLFMNLLTNARRAMADLPERLSILCETFDQFEADHSPCAHPDFPFGETCTTSTGQLSFTEPCVRVTVMDKGSGITSDVMGRIFEMYFSTRDDGTHGGVGMSSVADIVSDYGGGIRLTSRKGEGTAAEIVLPLLASNPFRPAVRKLDKTPAPGKACDVLLIDDDENVGNMIRQMLERSGITTEYHNSSVDALDLLLADHSRWKVVVSDQIMPHLRGSDIYRRLRESGITIPFIICSAQIDPSSGEIHDWVKDDFIPKPVNADVLLAKVRRYL